MAHRHPHPPSARQAAPTATAAEDYDDDAPPPEFVDAPAAANAAASPATAEKPRPLPQVATLSRRILQFSVVILYSSLLLLNTALLILLTYYWRIVWPFAVMYFCFIFLIDARTPYEGGTDRWAFVRNAPFWRHFGDYFNAELVKTAELDPAKNYIFGIHPHGIYAYGLFPNFITQYGRFAEKFPGIKLRVTTLDLNWSIPVWREIQMGLGCISVSAKSLKFVLTKMGPGRSAAIVVGGADEALLAYPHTNDLVLNRRKGFVKVAIQTGASLVPVFSFGENDLFWQVNNESAPAVRKTQQRLAKILSFSLPIYWGRFGLFFLPRKTRLVSVVGRPIAVKQKDSPTREEIEHVHALYVKELKRVFDDHKDSFVPDRKRDLRIVK
ncbi:diacylglycerol O-acyltransferase 1 [Geranomyces michiganensis]|nr:diacylglycerol O-acyltransferase 1 [Geranomyces michiganensis]